MSAKTKRSGVEIARNIVMVLMAGLLLLIFFRLDLFRGEGDANFLRLGERGIKFTGDLTPGEMNLSPEEMARLRDYLASHDDIVERMEISASAQDSYAEMTEGAQLMFEVKVYMRNGSTISTPVVRAERGQFMDRLIQKLDKDIRGWRDLGGGSRQGGGDLVNTM